MAYEIRIAKLEELELVKDFLINHWKKDHILTRNDELMLWQHANYKEQQLNYVIAIDSSNNQIDGLIGFIPTNHFDKFIIDHCAWIAIWKVREDAVRPGLGVLLYRQLVKELNLKAIGGYAISDVAFKIYKSLKFTNGKMSHFFIRNHKFNVFKIAQYSNNYQEASLKKASNQECIFTDWDKSSFPEITTAPRKTSVFYVNRYLAHPVYDYKIKSVFVQNELVCLFVYRVIEVNESKCLRIVDWAGKFPQNISTKFQELLQSEVAEYVDFLCHVSNPEEVLEMGFEEVSEEVIMPHYFEPFIQKTISLDYAYINNTGLPYALFKADGDQDRPNS